jgi:hypothetical protein
LPIEIGVHQRLKNLFQQLVKSVMLEALTERDKNKAKTRLAADERG